MTVRDVDIIQCGVGSRHFTFFFGKFDLAALCMGGVVFSTDYDSAKKFDFWTL